MQEEEQRAAKISIHTFLTEGDEEINFGAPENVISIHTFLTEGDLAVAAW